MTKQNLGVTITFSLLLLEHIASTSLGRNRNLLSCNSGAYITTWQNSFLLHVLWKNLSLCYFLQSTGLLAAPPHSPPTCPFPPFFHFCHIAIPVSYHVPIFKDTLLILLQSYSLPITKLMLYFHPQFLLARNVTYKFWRSQSKLLLSLQHCARALLSKCPWRGRGCQPRWKLPNKCYSYKGERRRKGNW